MKRKSFMNRLLALVLSVGLVMSTGSMSVLAASEDTAEPQVVEEVQETEEVKETEGLQKTEEVQGSEEVQIPEESQKKTAAPKTKEVKETGVAAYANGVIEVKVDNLGNILTSIDEVDAAIKAELGVTDELYYKDALIGAVPIKVKDGTNNLLKAYIKDGVSNVEVELFKMKNIFSYPSVGKVVLTVAHVDQAPTVTVQVDKDGNFVTAITDINSQLANVIGDNSEKYFAKSDVTWGDIADVFDVLDTNVDAEKVITIGYAGKTLGQPNKTFKVRFVTVAAPAEQHEIAVASENGSYSVTGASVKDGGIVVSAESETDVTFKVTSDNNYYVSGVTVDGNAVEDITYSAGKATFAVDFETAMEAENIVIEYAPVFVLNEGEYKVTIREGSDLTAIKAELEDSIIAQAVNKEASVEMGQVGVQFYSEAPLGAGSAWKALDEKVLLGKKFGANDVEKIKLSFAGNDMYPASTIEFTVQVETLAKEPSSLVFNDINVTYSEDAAAQKAQIFEAINREESILPEDITVDDIKVEYKFRLSLPFVGDIEIPSIGGVEFGFFELKDGSTIPAGTQTIKVTYKGNSDYASCTTEPMQINVAKAKASVVVNSQTINYGEEFAQVVTTTPEGVSTLTVITGMNAEITPYVSVILPELKANHVNTGNAAVDKIVNAGIDEAVKAANSALDSILNSGGTLKETLTAIVNNKELAEMIGIDLSSVEQLLGYLPDGVANIKVNVNKLPEDAGVYTVAAITLDPNYETAFGVGGLVINMDTNHELGWNEKLPVMLNWKKANLENAYDFGAKIKTEGVDADVKYEFYGFSNDGKFHTNTKPILEPGIYTEVAYLHLGNNYAAPIIRKYTVGRMHTVCENLNPEKTYDGQPMDLNEVFKLTGEDGKEIASGDYAVVYFNLSTGHFGDKAPTDAGKYKVIGTYCGDAFHRPTAVCGTFTIKPREVVVEVQDATKVYGEADPEFTYVVKDNDGNVIDEKFNVKLSREEGEDVGTYAITGKVSKCNNNKNYKVTQVVPGTLTITKRPIEVQIDDKVKTEGQKDPEFTYQIVDGSLVFDDTFSMKCIREEGEDVGKYEIFAEAYLISDNYDVTVNNGTLTIVAKEILFTVTYTDGVDDEEIFADQVYDQLKPGVATPEFDGTPEREGYTFTGWTPEVEETVLGNVVYTATWEKVEEPETPVDPEEPKDPEQPEQPADQDNVEADTPKTGDTMNYTLWIVLMGCAVFAGVLVVRRKKAR